MKVNALILAGGTVTGELKDICKTDIKALIKFNEKPMIEYVLDALHGCPIVDKTMCVGNKVILKPILATKVSEVIPEGKNMLENILNGINVFGIDKHLLICTCDIPLITPEIITNFLIACQKEKFDLYYPVIEKNLFNEKFPLTKRTYGRVREGKFTGGNVVFVNPFVFQKNFALIDRVIQSRKSPLKLISMLGVGFIIRFIFHTITISDIEKKVEQILECKVTAIRTSDPEIGIDVDKMADYVLVKDYLVNKNFKNSSK